MGMSTHLIALRDMDGEFAKMLKAKLFCDENRLSYPAEVEAYFQGMADESESLLCNEFLEVDIRVAVTEWRDNGASREGYEVEIAKLPPEVKTIRFYNSW
jgi:hypothetical protein